LAHSVHGVQPMAQTLTNVTVTPTFNITIITAKTIMTQLYTAVNK